MIRILIAVLAFGLMFVGIEFLQKKTGLKRSITRKIAHIGGSLGAAALPWFLSYAAIAWISVFFALVMLVSKRQKIFKSVHNVKRRTFGEVYLPLGVLLLCIFAQNHAVFACALLVLGLADPAAEAAGSRWGYKRIGATGKSWVGSLAFTLVAYLLCLAFYRFAFNRSWMQAAIVAFITAAVTAYAEVLSEDGTDNITIPAVVAVFASVLH